MNITFIADKLCDIYGLTTKEIADITTKNSKDVFGV
jgi:TatD DNase family protein